MRWDNASKVSEVVWQMRLADLPRGENRAIIQRQFNGDPPFDDAEAEENNVQINRNFLEGVNLMTQARRQWNQAFLKPGNYFSVTLDSGPDNKRKEWGHTITRHANRLLKGNRRMMNQIRATGANVMLHGIGPCTWETRRCIIPTPLAISSVMIPSETDIDLENLPYIAFFREWTPAHLYSLTHGPKVDKGWQMDVVKSQMAYVATQIQKQPNATAYQYMPERIEELVKQDLGFWGSDAVPTIDAWDFYFRDEEAGGWKRRVILDWGVGEGLTKDSPMPKAKNEKADGKFLYDSKNRVFAKSLDELFHCNFGDTSCSAPFKYHSVRSLGWMLWGVCDLQNRLSCRFNESVFQQLMWFFETASNSDVVRLKRADFHHLGVIPAGIRWVKSADRFTPNAELVQMAFSRNRQLMSENAAAFTQDFDRGAGQKEMTATETMARVNSVNALVSGMLSMAYEYEAFKYREICRRFCITQNPDTMASKFRLLCLKDGVPSKYLDSQYWIVDPERVLGAGNKTLEMAQAQFLQGIRKNLGPDAQREVDHIAIESNTDDPAMAERLAPLAGQKQVSDSMHDAQLSTERLMRGLPFVARPDMVYEDYVKVWLADLGLMVGRALQMGRGMAKPEEIMGWQTISAQIKQFLGIMGQNPEDKERVKGYAQALAKLDNQLKAFIQRLQAAAKASAGKNGQGGGLDPKDAAKIAAEQAKAQTKLVQMSQSHATRTAQRQVQFNLEQQRLDRQTNAEIRRENAKAAHEVVRNSMRSLNGKPTNEE